MDHIYWYDSLQHFMNIHNTRKSQRWKYIIGKLMNNFSIGKYLYWMIIKQIRIIDHLEPRKYFLGLFLVNIIFFTSFMLNLKMEQHIDQFILSNMEGNYRMYLYFKYLFNVENRLTA